MLEKELKKYLGKKLSEIPKEILGYFPVIDNDIVIDFYNIENLSVFNRIEIDALVFNESKGEYYFKNQIELNEIFAFFVRRIRKKDRTDLTHAIEVFINKENVNKECRREYLQRTWTQEEYLNFPEFLPK